MIFPYINIFVPKWIYFNIGHWWLNSLAIPADSMQLLPKSIDLRLHIFKLKGLIKSISLAFKSILIMINFLIYVYN